MTKRVTIKYFLIFYVNSNLVVTIIIVSAGRQINVYLLFFFLTYTQLFRLFRFPLSSENSQESGLRQQHDMMN